MFLLLVLVRNPVAFLRAVSLDFTFGRPGDAFAKYLTRRTEIVVEAARNFEGYTGRFEIDRRGLVLGWYDAAHEIARLELYRAGRDYAVRGNTGCYAWRKLLGPVSLDLRSPEGRLDDLADGISKTTGLVRWSTLGISQARGKMESAIFFDRYLRCLLGLVWNALQDGVRGNESRRLFIQLAAVGVVAYFVAAL